MAVVTAGRGNDLARRLGLPTDPAGLAALLLHGPVRRLDVIEVEGGAPSSGGAVGAGGGVLVPGNVYAGIDSVANAIINRSRLPGWLAYRTAPLRAIASWRPPVYALECDGRARSVRAHTVVVANTGAYGHGLAIVPPAEPDDGWLHVMLVGAGPRRAVAGFLWQARTGAHVGRPEVEIGSAGQVRLSADRDLALYGDGDEVARLPVTVRVRPAALRLLVGAT
jgi:diacylglycerol kinase family enzyme